MAKLLSRSNEDVIKKVAAEEYPKEACGVLTKKGKKIVAVRCVNTSHDPENRFVISSAEYRHHLDTGGVYGIWHSHTDEPPTPSPTDVAACNSTAVDWFVISVSKNDLNELCFSDLVYLAPSHVNEAYVERSYIYGVKDCFTLVRDWYKHEFDIDINFRAEGYPEIADWQNRGMNILVDSYKQAGFVRLSDEVAEIGDIFLIQMSATTDHIAIYVGDDKILHHCIGRLSTTDTYGGGYWQKHTTHRLRHESRRL